VQVLIRHRRGLASGFSDKALRDQEPLLNKPFDLLMQRFHENAGKAIDISAWFEFLTFDIIGDLTFGEDFGCLENSKASVRLQSSSVINNSCT
jgi:cytochrome P450